MRCLLCCVNKLWQGCDGSILVDLESNSYYKSEMRSSRNLGIGKREVVSLLKSVVEAQCPQQVSCADILILAAREAISVSGGPRIDVPLGRRDSSNPPNPSLADSSLPPSNLGVNDMLQLFAQKGLSLEESVAINGAHTLGITHCFSIESRLYDESKNDEPSEHEFELYLKLSCPKGSLTSNKLGNRKEVVSLLKSVVEAQCPQQVSCADILILAAREAISVSGGPRIDVPLGRRDSSIHQIHR
ncbi:hypothetical protein H5410_004246 [Solanum commersonii]|uniref:peroxidase n=1 Tax=Solanum commersonii TaxID=4109 RepID=A0A9J6B788_SOLCO|nr:hypothetical protein H5410_004246 [Solanum commersonii]